MMNITPMHSNSGPRILIAIEDPIEALALESIMRAEHYSDIRITTDTREVVPMHKHWPFQVLVLDMHSREMDGFHIIDELGHAIRRAELSIISLVNKGAEELRMLSVASGAIGTVARPILHHQAIPAIRDAMKAVPMRISSF
ncbi:MAG: response regulator [Magnetovibrio sp.]|nr:response regulator [Magnetovibrio sp.]